MSIARSLEDAARGWLLACNTPTAGGLMLYRTQEGAGALLEIRTGHDERGELPSDGYVLCQCLDNAVEQQIPDLNAWAAVLTVALSYPYDAHQGDQRNVPAFDWVCREIQTTLTSPDLPARLSAQNTGVEVLGYVQGITHTSSIEGQVRQAEWAMSLMVAQTSIIPGL